MKNLKKIIFADWPLGLALMAVVLLAYYMHWGPLMALEYYAYDFRAKQLKAAPSAPVTVVAIDDESIDRIGRWPWPRKHMASFLDLMSQYKAKVVGVHVLYPEPVHEPGQDALGELKGIIEGMKDYEKDARLMELYDEVLFQEGELNNDAKFAEALGKNGHVVLPQFFKVSGNQGPMNESFEEYLKRNSVPVPVGTARPLVAEVMVNPIPLFANSAAGLGHDNLFADLDGTVRRANLMVEYGGRLFPSFALQLVLKYLNIEPGKMDLSNGIGIGKLHIPADETYSAQIRYTTGDFPTHSFVRVMTEEVPASEFKDRIVLVSLTGTGLSPLSVTPHGPTYSAYIVAHSIDNILSGSFITRPDWARYAEPAVILLFGLYVAFAVPRMKAFLSAAVTAVLLIAWNGAAIYLFTSEGLWLMMLPQTLLLGVAYTVLVSKRFMVTEKGKEKVEADSIETNKMLGLSFQSQGMLDLALDKFMKCPIDDETVKEHLYNLALDFERKRMFNKAVSVYEHILKDGDYKDLKQKVEKLTKLGDTMIFGAPLGGGKRDSTVVVEGSDLTTPTLGRYEVQRELGRGAMGTVYLGKDPKINRMVAIKTIRFDEVDQSQIKAVKERFFREAEAAGRIAHPNIVTIYDAGEDYDLAYVAMELLDGTDLSDYLQKLGKAMPSKMAIQVVGMVAQALDHAHKHGVVHRDIKPANIMLLKNGTVKVTDFGIARVMESSKTQTGVVLGTPSYMSPEQVLGKKVDGRSDLFSLGVMFYELLSFQKPFGGDSIATLMYNIANTPHPPIKEEAPQVPDCCAAIVDRMLEKDLEKRYQVGKDIARDLATCLKTLR